jgi:hypothetical protein
MEKTKEEDYELYLLASTKNIDSLIRKNDFKKAFKVLILVLEKLDDNQKNEFIDYYSKNIFFM